MLCLSTNPNRINPRLRSLYNNTFADTRRVPDIDHAKMLPQMQKINKYIFQFSTISFNIVDNEDWKWCSRWSLQPLKEKLFITAGAVLNYGLFFFFLTHFPPDMPDCLQYIKVTANQYFYQTKVLIKKKTKRCTDITHCLSVKWLPGIRNLFFFTLLQAVKEPLLSYGD